MGPDIRAFSGVKILKYGGIHTAPMTAPETMGLLLKYHHDVQIKLVV